MGYKDTSGWLYMLSLVCKTIWVLYLLCRYCLLCRYSKEANYCKMNSVRTWHVTRGAARFGIVTWTHRPRRDGHRDYNVVYG